MQKSTSFFEIMVELAPLNEGPRGPVPTLKKGTLSRVFLYEHDNTSGTKWPPRGFDRKKDDLIVLKPLCLH